LLALINKSTIIQNGTKLTATPTDCPYVIAARSAGEQRKPRPKFLGTATVLNYCKQTVPDEF